MQQQLSILKPAAPVVDLRSYDVILVNSSAGKDSQAMLDYVVDLADAAGVRDRIVVVHCDLGRVEWKGTRDLAEKQAKHYGLRFEVVARNRDLLHQIEHERRKFPDNSNRYCTSDQKTKQVVKLITQLVREVGPKLDAAGRTTGPVRILQTLGIRADESPRRRKLDPFTADTCSNGKRTVHRWFPIHAWSVAQVWARIKASGVPHHPAYDLGMPRLSCCFCILASRSALVLAAKHNPELAAEYVRVEAAIGHTFQPPRKPKKGGTVVPGTTMADIVAEAEWSQVQHVANWHG